MIYNQPTANDRSEFYVGILCGVAASAVLALVIILIERFSQ